MLQLCDIINFILRFYFNVAIEILDEDIKCVFNSSNFSCVCGKLDTSRIYGDIEFRLQTLRFW